MSWPYLAYLRPGALPSVISSKTCDGKSTKQHNGPNLRSLPLWLGIWPWVLLEDAHATCHRVCPSPSRCSLSEAGLTRLDIGPGTLLDWSAGISLLSPPTRRIKCRQLWNGRLLMLLMPQPLVRAQRSSLVISRTLLRLNQSYSRERLLQARLLLALNR